MDYYKPSLSLDADYYYIKSEQNVYVKSTISVGLPSGVNCYFDSVNPDPNDPANFIMKYLTSNDGTNNGDHTYNDVRNNVVISNVDAENEAEVVAIINHVLEDLHKSTFSISGDVRKPDGSEGGEGTRTCDSPPRVIFLK